MGGRGSSSFVSATSLVDSIRDSTYDRVGVALSITNRNGGGRQTTAPPGERGGFRLITSRGTAEISRREAIKYVNSAIEAGYVVKKV